MVSEPEIRKNRWIHYLLATVTIAYIGAAMLIFGVLMPGDPLSFLLIPLPLHSIVMWGLIIGGGVLIIIAIILLRRGLRLYQIEKEYDRRMGLAK